ncbi:hypothetical protein ACL7TT_06765 [Microbulbifer sp. 2304DJ12-6]|uniref:hypothetical protein n=1 Tax=Microbulbifer sp. 2304DJ12-6 TaxID=3233340 RepID=UPI0039B07DD5
MPHNTDSARGIKEIENQHRNKNLIAKYKINNVGAVAAGTAVTVQHLHNDLFNFLKAGNKPLLWVYIKDKQAHNQGPLPCEIAFGFDRHYGEQKIGHGALSERATLAGEIHWSTSHFGASHWVITNQSGAWGAMGGIDGKTAELQAVAQIMNELLFPHVEVISKNAYSRHGWKRAAQEQYNKVSNRYG